MLISKKLDARDRERTEAERAAVEGRAMKRPGSSGTNFLPDYKQALQAQIAASSERAAKKAAKDERRRLSREAAAASATGEAAAASAASSASQAAESTQATVSLSKSVVQQRLAKADRAAEEARRSADAQLKAKAAADAAASAAAVAAAEAHAAAESSNAAAAAAKLTFTTEMRAGESFRSYQARLVREKAEKMEGKVLAKKISEKKKRCVLQSQIILSMHPAHVVSPSFKLLKRMCDHTLPDMVEKLFLPVYRSCSCSFISSWDHISL
jgi:hypothetical protein